MPVALPPTPPAEIQVTNADDNSRYILTGLRVYGREAELDKFAAAAKAQGLTMARAPAPKSEYYTTGNIMIAFRPGSDMKAALDFYHLTVRGDLGQLNVRSLVVSLADAHDADGIKGSEVEDWDPEDTVEN